MRVRPLCALAATSVALAGCSEPAADRAPDPRVVSVSARSGAGRAEVATGFTVGRGRVVTVAHLLDDGGRLEVHGGGGPWAARLLRLDRESDLALLRVPGLRARALPIRERDGDGGERLRLLVLRARRTVARSALVRRRIDASVRRAPGARARRRPALELDAEAEPGDSGAPLVAPGGELAAVLFAQSRRRERTAYAVTATAVRDLLVGAAPRRRIAAD